MASKEQIDGFVRQVAEEFRPQKVLLFGSHARGAQTPDSDVDLLVVMPFEGKPWHRATAIRDRLRPDFPMDLLIRTPEQIQERLRKGDAFIRQVVEEGKVLYEAPDR